VGDDWFWSKQEYKRLGRILDREQNLHLTHLTTIIARMERHCSVLRRWCLAHNQRSYHQAGANELLRIFEEYWSMCQRVATFLEVKHVLNRVLERRIRQQLTKYLQSESSNQVNEIFECLLVPTKDTLAREAHKKLLRLAQARVSNRASIEHWLELYSSITTFHWLGRPLTERQVKRQIVELKRIKYVKQHGSNNYRRIIQKLGLKGSIIREIEALQQLFYLHTYELECLFASKYWSKNLLTEVARRIGLTYNSYVNATYQEIISALKGQKLDIPKLLARRHNQFALFRLANGITLLQGAGFRKLLNATKVRETKIAEVRGSVAFTGMARGRVRVIKTTYDFNRFKAGDIVVTPMTTIDFTTYLPKAGAIVTDEGGITCHAAIVSRELKIPCIIGTKIATRVLKDNDLVVVDAIKGIVRKL